MSILSTMDSADLENRCHAMRHELKAWEKLFASQHNGRKAGRDDIKANAAISQKYKEYGRIRDLLAGKAAPQTPSKATRRRKSTADVDRTPRARAPTTTPRKRKLTDENDPVAGEEEISVLLSPHGPAMIGPTPQRDGIVLGLFDLLPAETPSKRRAVLGDAVPNIIKTPSKGHNKEESEGSFESRGRVEKTPMSSSKRFLLDRFVTPRKRKLDDAGTPTSALKGFSTPSFLRRDNVLVVVNEEDEETPRPAPWKRRGLGRSLSSMIQSMKRQEEDRLDEEAEIMRELEMEAEGIPVPKKQKVPDILVEDSQAAMPLGPDGAGASDDDSDKDDEDNGQNQNGRPRKVWKKRGQKRQTRRVIMRPNFVKPPPRAAAQVVGSDSETENPPVENVPTTAVSSSKTVGSDQEFSEDDDGSDYASDHSHTPKQRKTQPKRHEPESKTQPNDKAAKEGPVKAAARKVKATAHANFRRLKIKSSTGAKGGKGRFGRPTHPIRQRPSGKLAPGPHPPNPGPPPPPTTSISSILSSATPAKPPYNPHNPISPANMAENELRELIKQLHQTLQSHKYQQSTSLLSRAKVALLHMKALIPSETSTRTQLALARETLELGAIISIRLKDPVAFTRYFQQLQPFYSLPANKLPKDGGNSSKITGLYLLLLLSDGDYAGFHTLLETLEVEAAHAGGKGLEEDVFIQYPIRLEQALMEGSYDKVWVETKSERVPSEEFALFSEVLIGTIRKEIASCSEKAYPSIPISDAKSLLFLESEGSVVSFAKECGWIVKDSRIYFPAQEDEYSTSKDILVTSGQIIENTLGYARELETIV
ncbi:DNA replication and checkpoint protein-domain-containing protein [Clohesyomyces aquaticus]|uniref:DNA replication regulator SLD2 n=1 Tax=Clohesyomyces aquaticus TaxID=1231657 RepID=A0A1Y1ZSS4_9PLEO|nr:DNA replication and checkpoint protein-domain-containing protein [Clohesyomyces aquaticus]